MLARQTRSPSRPMPVHSAVLLAAAALFSLKPAASAHVATQGSPARPYTASQTIAPAPLAGTSAIADPALVRLIELHRSATYPAVALARLPQDGPCCAIERLPAGQ
jgi:hypothetical protein